MSKFISIKVMRGTFPKDEKKYAPFAGEPGAIFHVETDQGKSKYIPISEPPFNVDDMKEPDWVEAFVAMSLMMGHALDEEITLIDGGELVAEFRMTPNEEGAAEIESV
ncbi:hypothetical protein L1G94_000541 [Escherichia coli]|nr:hypothetical protein [Escherichia coli]